MGRSEEELEECKRGFNKRRYFILNLLKINLSMEDVVKMTSFSAAKYLNDDTIGYIKEGYRSNFLVLDQDLNIEKIFLNGNLVND